MNEYAEELKEKLRKLIREMRLTSSLFIKKPETDFSRERKLPFESVMEMIISMGGNSIYKELLEWQGYDVSTATTSAFVQARAKIQPFAFEYLLTRFTELHSPAKKYRGYRVLAADGTSLHIPTNPADKETYIEANPKAKGYNLMHMSALYDLCNRIYIDACVQNARSLNEHKALIDMLGSLRIRDNIIIIADRHYESYNIFAHIETKGCNYVIRVKDINSNGIVPSLGLPLDGEFDLCVQRTLTRNTRKAKTNPQVYKRISNSTAFDFLKPRTRKNYPISFRVARIKISDDFYETIITNLDSSFTPDDIKTLYAMRWGIETSFRQLKYIIGLVNFHAKKRDFITQEIFARLIMYNFTEMITSRVVISLADTKHIYQVNFSVAVAVCRRFLRRTNPEQPPDVEALIRKNILPVRTERRYIRNFRNQKSVVSFIYRIA